MQFISCLESPVMRVNNVVVRGGHSDTPFPDYWSIIHYIHCSQVLALVNRYQIKISIISICNIYNICAGADPGQDV